MIGMKCEQCAPMCCSQDPAILKDKPEFSASIEEMGERYYNELVRYFPDGPYYLGGWSMGMAAGWSQVALSGLELRENA
jgi:thioesterase domain-containing protein